MRNSLNKLFWILDSQIEWFISIQKFKFLAGLRKAEKLLSSIAKWLEKNLKRKSKFIFQLE